MKKCLKITLVAVLLCATACAKSSFNAINETEAEVSVHKDPENDLSSLFNSLKTSDKISFTANDLDGKEWKSEDIFNKHKLTLVNIWGTTCGYCIIEMPELEQLSKRVKPEDYGVMGIIVDGEMKKDDAKEILTMTGVTYPNICMNQELFDDLLVQVMPTTYFVDNSGKVIGNPIYGAQSGSQYEQELISRLATIK